jgi:uncharacterized membrane protein YhaH (DUF805 family)
MDFFQLLFGFSGRINRAKYWLAALIYLVVMLIAVGLAFAGGMVMMLFLVVAVIIYAPVIISGIAVGIKRLHDRDKSGWWLLVFYVLPGVLSGLANQVGLQVILSLASFALSIWGFVELGCLRGTAGPNQYGPDPLQG